MDTEIINHIIEQMLANAQTVTPRPQLSEMMGGLVSHRTLANWDAKGLGPKVKVSIGRRVGYTRDSIEEWLKQKLTVVNGKLKISHHPKKENLQ